MTGHRLVIVESPFRAKTPADRIRNQSYLNRCLRDSLDRGESPYASHAILIGPLDDRLPAERQRGIEAGYAWWNVAEAIIFYTDLGWSEGMLFAQTRAIEAGFEIEHRKIFTCE